MENLQSKYNVWTTEENNELLKLMIEAATQGWRDRSGVFSKKIVETKILPALNKKLACQKNFTQYQSRLKRFKQRYINYCKLMRLNSSFRLPITSKGYDYIHRILKEDPTHFREIYRMHLSEFLKLCNILREKKPLQDIRYICIEEMVAMFLLVFGHNTRYSLIRKTFDRSHYNTSQNFNKVLKALNSIAADMMVKPESIVLKRIRESTRFFPYFKDCIGAIDGSHIPAMVPGHDTNSYCNRHGIISQNILTDCNFDFKFIYVLSEWEGSAHDSNVLTDALSRNNGLKVPQGKYFLVDGGYPNRRQFLAPFRGVCYHLQEFTSQGRHPENEKELFNIRHASLRNVIERVFGIFKSQFKIFKTTPPFSYTTQVELVLACAGLHNFLRKECRSDEFSVEPDNEASSSLPEKVHEIDCFNKLFDTQEQQRANANAWRDTIANRMWSDVQHIGNNEP